MVICQRIKYCIFAIIFLAACEYKDITIDDYSNDEIKYFMEVALGAEYGESKQVVRKWTNNIRISVQGNPTEEDLVTLENAIDDINFIISDKIQLKINDENPNIIIKFVPYKLMPQNNKHYVPGNLGFFYTWYNSSNKIYKADILIANDFTCQENRNHLIYEELTQCLGLMNDSWVYEDSIFYQGFSSPQKLADIDETILEILYLDIIKAGLTELQLEQLIY